MLGSLSSCFEGSGGDSSSSDNYDFIPDLEIECSVAQANACSNASVGKTVYVGATADSQVSCGDYLSLTTTNNFASYFDASGSTTVEYNTFITGFVTSWSGDSRQNIGELQIKTYMTCAFLDTNENGRLDAGEPVGQGQLVPGNNNTYINDWFEY